jgi:hypothetical protein
MPPTVAVNVSQRLAFSPFTPSQCQPPPAVYQATQPRVDTGVCVAVVKSASTRYACAAPEPSVHCRWPSVQKLLAGSGLPTLRVKASFVLLPPCLTVAVAGTVLRLTMRLETFSETFSLAVERFAAQRYDPLAIEPFVTERAVTLTVPLPWQASATENVLLARFSATLLAPSSPGPVTPPGIAPGVPGGTNGGAVPGGAGRSAPLPGGGPGGPGGPGGACATAPAGSATAAAAARTIRLGSFTSIE